MKKGGQKPSSNDNDLIFHLTGKSGEKHRKERSDMSNLNEENTLQLSIVEKN